MHRQTQSMKARLLSLICHAYEEFKPSSYLDDYVNSLGKIRCDDATHQSDMLHSLGLMLVRIDCSDYIYEQEALTPRAVEFHNAWIDIVNEYNLVPSKKDPTLSLTKLGSEGLTVSNAISFCIDTYLSHVKVDTRILLKAGLHQTVIELQDKYVLANAEVLAALVAAMTVWVNMSQYRLAYHAELRPVYEAYMKLRAS